MNDQHLNAVEIEIIKNKGYKQFQYIQQNIISYIVHNNNDTNTNTNNQEMIAQMTKMNEMQQLLTGVSQIQLDEKNEKESKSKKPSRVQDIPIVDSDHHQDTDHSKHWPYEKEKSPCRIHGRKNTRPGPEADAINKEYVDPNFADKTKNSLFGTDHECDADGEHQPVDSENEKDDLFNQNQF